MEDERLARLNLRRERQQEEADLQDEFFPANMANNNAGQADTAAILQALQQAVTALTQGQQDLATIVGNLAPAQQNVPFHLSPAQYDTTAMLDLTSRAGRSIFEDAQRGHATKYDLSRDGLPAFINAAKTAATRLGCNVGNDSVCHFTAADGGDLLHIVDKYGQLSIDRITNQATPYLTGNNNNSRQAQNNMIMATWTLASLAAEARVEIETYASEYTIGDKICFALLWKRIVNVPSMDSTVTARNIRSSLDGLPAEIPNMTIADFNQKLTNLATQLSSRGETKDDLVTLILTAYQNTTDSRFNDYWRRMESDLDDNIGILVGMTWQQVLAKGATKYSQYQDDWGKKSKYEEDFIALTAQLRGQLELKTPPKGKSKKSKAKGKGSPPASKQSSNSDGPVAKNKKPTGDRKRQKADEKWKKTPPKDGEPHTKTVNGWECHWCEHHMAWCGHKSRDCELGKRRAREQQQASYQARTSTSAATDPAVDHQRDYMAKLAGLSRLHE